MSTQKNDILLTLDLQMISCSNLRVVDIVDFYKTYF